MRSIHRVARNTLLLTTGLLFVRLLAFLVFRRLAGQEGAAGIGVWGVAAELSAILTVVACFGLNTVLTREIIKGPERAWDLFWSSLRLRGLVGAAGYAALVGFVGLAGYDAVTRQAVLVMAIGVFLETAAMNCDAVLQAREEVRHQTVSQILGAAVYFVLAWAWLRQGAGLMGVVWASVASRGARLALVSLLVVPGLLPSRGAARRRGAGAAPSLRGMAWPVFLATVLGIATLKIDTVMLLSMGGKVEAGLYTAGRRPLEFLMLLPQLFAVALFPALQRARGLRSTAAGTAAGSGLEQMGERAHRYLGALILPLTLGCFVAARPLIGLLAPGPAFGGAAVVLRVVLLGLPLLAVTTVCNRLLMCLDRERDLVLVSGWALGVDVALNLVLIPRWSERGSAVASVASLMVACGIYLWLIRRAGLRIPLARSQLVALGALAVAWLGSVGALRLLHPVWVPGWPMTVVDRWPALLTAGALTAPIYVGLLCALGILRRSEWASLSRPTARAGRTGP